MAKSSRGGKIGASSSGAGGLDQRYEQYSEHLKEYNRMAMTGTEWQEVVTKELPKMYKLISELKEEVKKYEGAGIRGIDLTMWGKRANQQWAIGDYIRSYEKRLADKDFKLAEEFRKQRRGKYGVSDRDLYD